MSVISFQFENDAGEERTINLPARWVICHDCRGAGKSSAHLGAITEEDRQRDWSDDEFDDYVDGFYDKRCEACDGAGKRLEIDREANLSLEQRDAIIRMDADAEDDRLCASIERMERMSGA